jgi:hypothetical protein
MRSSVVTPSSLRPVVLSTFLFATRLAAPAHAQPLLEPSSAPPLPAATVLSPAVNIQVDPLLRPLIAKLLEKSPTLRRQWEAIGAAAAVRVSVMSTPLLREALSARARTEVSRFALGGIRAVVELPAVVDITELLPHELEHVIEQIEGLNLPALARSGAAGVREISRGVFETSRARDAGLLAVREVYGEVDPALSAAARRVKRAWKVLAADGTPAAAAPDAAPAPPIRARTTRLQGPPPHKRD